MVLSMETQGKRLVVFFLVFFFGKEGWSKRMELESTPRYLSLKPMSTTISPPNLGSQAEFERQREGLASILAEAPKNLPEEFSRDMDGLRLP